MSEPIPRLTDEEARLVRAFFDELMEGKTCPHCHQAIAKKVQVGRCVYAEPCNHRLYQGQLHKGGGR